jgi:quinol monooxygenase YgiN
MSDTVSWMLELSVAPGREKELRALMEEMVGATRAGEPGTLSYEWSTSEDGRVCHIYERYADSAAVLAHLKTFDEQFMSRFNELLAPVRMVIYGSPSAPIREAMADTNPTYMKPVGGFTR